MRTLATAIELVRFYFRIVPSRWYRRFPFLPVPRRKYLEWRFQTAYGAWRPGWPTVVHDAWQFGTWLRDSRFSKPTKRRASP